MKTFLIKYTDPLTNEQCQHKLKAEDKTDARDKFFDKLPDVYLIDKIIALPEK